jgi:hypothetical protein
MVSLKSASDGDCCRYCKKPILDGEARYTGGEPQQQFAHWDCREADRKKLIEGLESIDMKFADLGIVTDVGGRMAAMLRRLKI